MKKAFGEHEANRRELERQILDLIRSYEAVNGWIITQVEYYATGGRVITEAVPAAKGLV